MGTVGALGFIFGVVTLAATIIAFVAYGISAIIAVRNAEEGNTNEHS